MHVYISGPMRGYEDYNHTAFHSAARDLRAQGQKVFNPAEVFNGDTSRPTKDYLQLDLRAVLDASMVVVLPGWEHSDGARLEIAVAAAIGCPVRLYDYTDDTWTPETADELTFDQEAGFEQFLADVDIIDESKGVFGLAPPAWGEVLQPGDLVQPAPSAMEQSPVQEAARLVDGDRQDDYGHPYEDFTRTAAMWTAIFGHTITAEQVALAMVALKISREVNKPKRDNIVDGIGYFQTLHMVRQRRRELEDGVEFTGSTYGDLTLIPGGKHED
jgi:hypothetical protein